MYIILFMISQAKVVLYKLSKINNSSMPGKGNKFINHNNVVHTIICNIPVKMTIGKKYLCI